MSTDSKLFRKIQPPFPLGRRNIGRYELVCPLSSGGMATVYLGRLSGIAGFEKLVAVKVIHPHLIAQKKFVDMFLDEARLSAKIHHPNLVEIFEVGEVDGLYFMVAELVRGRSLSQLIEATHRANKKLEPPLYVTIMARVCDALHSAHNVKAADGSPLGLVHRDISPSNILISYDGIVKLIDFGIAFAKGRIAKTESGVVKGKLDYMAPEQLRRKAVDRRIDIFSVGVVLYELATGQHPFFGNDEWGQLDKQLKCTPTPPRDIVPEIDFELERTILKALSENPKQRHQTAKDFGDKLRSLMVLKGALVDQQTIADLMSELFAQEIAQDNETFENAVEKHPPARHVDFTKQDSFGANDQIATAKSATHEIEAPITDVLTTSFDAPKNRLPHRSVIVPVVVILACLTVLLAWLFRYERQKPSDIINAPSNAHPALDSKTEPRAMSNETEVTKKTVKIRLKGLPTSATVTLDGAETTVTEGQLIVPADGAQRVLQITAKGYKPHVRRISPGEDVEMTVELKKKKIGQRKQGHTKKRKQEKKPNNTLQTCPYCD